jgi:hypothetical protein
MPPRARGAALRTRQGLPQRRRGGIGTRPRVIPALRPRPTAGGLVTRSGARRIPARGSGAPRRDARRCAARRRRPTRRPCQATSSQARRRARAGCDRATPEMPGLPLGGREGGRRLGQLRTAGRRSGAGATCACRRASHTGKTTACRCMRSHRGARPVCGASEGPGARGSVRADLRREARCGGRGGAEER